MRLSISKYHYGNNIKIVHFSDIHFDSKYNLKRFDLILNKVSELKPNYICITGDLIDNSDVLLNKSNYSFFSNFLIELTKISKVIITLGNHEMRFGNIDNYKNTINLLKKIPNIIVLDNEMYSDNNITFVGFNPSYNYYLNPTDDDFIKDYNNCNFKLSDKNILLVHTPKNILNDKIYNTCNLNKYELILSGHTHGGMVPLWVKGNRGLISPHNEILPKNARGSIKRDNTRLIVCSAIVRLSNSAKYLNKLNDIYSMHMNYIEI